MTAKGANNQNLRAAKRAKNDEFYTHYVDIEKEMNAYIDYEPDVFRDKVVLLPCDDPEWSNFTKYFALNFDRLGLRKLISTSYAPDSKPDCVGAVPTAFETSSPHYDQTKSKSRGKIYSLDRDNTGDGKIDIDDLQWDYLSGDGDFRSAEVKALRDQADIIITNPPFSLFREFLAWMPADGNRKFVILGNMNAITYKEVFPLIKANRLWTGATGFNVAMPFYVPQDFVYAPTYKGPKDVGGRAVCQVPAICWYTNIDHGRRHEPLQLMTLTENQKFSKHKSVRGIGYKQYDNLDGIEVPYVDAIPSDYIGVMGVPISFLGKYNPDQFEIVDYPDNKVGPGQWVPYVEGETKYARILIKHRNRSTNSQDGAKDVASL